MLTIKTIVKRSELHGLGVFASENISKGKVIWEYFPMIDITYSLEKWRELELNLAPASFETIKRYAYKENGVYVVCMDNAQFMNHSHEYYNVANTDDLKSMYATRDIAQGEELLCNYLEYSDDDDHHIQKLNLN